VHFRGASGPGFAVQENSAKRRTRAFSYSIQLEKSSYHAVIGIDDKREMD